MIGFLSLVACSGEQSLTWAEQWELLVLDPGRGTVDLRITRSNTGALKGSPRVRGAYHSKAEGSLLFGLDGMPGDVERLSAGIRVGPDLLRGHEQGWELQLQEGGEQGDPRNMRLNIDSAGVPDQSLQMAGWTVQPLELMGRANGFASAPMRNYLLGGKALLIHRSGERPPVWKGADHTTVFVTAPNMSIGIDQSGSQALAWANIDGTLAWADAVLTGSFEEDWLLDFAPELPLQVKIRTRGQGHIDRPFEHLSGPESAVLDARYGTLSRELRTGRAKILVGESTVIGNAVVAHTAWE